FNERLKLVATARWSSGLFDDVVKKTARRQPRYIRFDRARRNGRGPRVFPLGSCEISKCLAAAEQRIRLEKDEFMEAEVQRSNLEAQLAHNVVEIVAIDGQRSAAAIGPAAEIAKNEDSKRIVSLRTRQFRGRLRFGSVHIQDDGARGISLRH